MPATKSLIQEITLESDASTVTFSNIPGTYTDLMVLVSQRNTSNNGGIGIRFNSDSGANYTYRVLDANGSAASSFTQAVAAGYNTYIFARSNASTMTASTFGSLSLYIPNYAGSTNKSCSIDSCTETNATTSYIAAVAALWSNTNAITSITFITDPGGNAGSNASGSSFYLYGIQASPNTPILTQGTQTLTSTEVTISNYNAALTYTATSSAGTPSVSGNTVTVTGLSAEQTVTVSVTASDSNGYTSATASGSFVSAAAVSGGTVTISGGYKIHTFTSSDTLIVNSAKTVEYLVIAGGGGGGEGGGGAGGYRTSVPGSTSGGNSSAESTISLPVGTYSIVVGSGGTGNGYFAPGADGSPSSFHTISSVGGGGGGSQGNSSNPVGRTGGSGGGSTSVGGTISGGSATSNQGFNGGSCSYVNSPSIYWAGGGGGGAGAVGSNANRAEQPSTFGGPGGNGLSSSITGTAVTRAGGGGGSDERNVASPSGGSGGGGRGWTKISTATSGTINTGSGGGGSSWTLSNTSGSGGSGIVIIRYAI